MQCLRYHSTHPTTLSPSSNLSSHLDPPISIPPLLMPLPLPPTSKKILLTIPPSIMLQDQVPSTPLFKMLHLLLPLEDYLVLMLILLLIPPQLMLDSVMEEQLGVLTQHPLTGPTTELHLPQQFQ